MKVLFDHQVMSSFLLWFDHYLLEKGEAYTNYSSKFYPVDNSFTAYTTYSAPFKGFVADSSVTNATIMTGIYLGNSFVTNGISGFVDIDYEEGNIYMDSAQTLQVSGDYSIKEYNVKFSDKSEETILFETKFRKNNEERTQYNIESTGIYDSAETYPAIYILNNGTRNDEFVFGGQELTVTDVRAVVMGDSLFSVDGVCSIFRDRERTHVCLLDESEYPFNALGGFVGTSYNYTGIEASKPTESGLYIEKVSVSRLPRASATEITIENPEIYSAIIDFELHKYRRPRA